LNNNNSLAISLAIVLVGSPIRSKLVFETWGYQNMN